MEFLFIFEYFQIHCRFVKEQKISHILWLLKHHISVFFFDGCFIKVLMNFILQLCKYRMVLTNKAYFNATWFAMRRFILVVEKISFLHFFAFSIECLFIWIIQCHLFNKVTVWVENQKSIILLEEYISIHKKCTEVARFISIIWD